MRVIYSILTIIITTLGVVVAILAWQFPKDIPPQHDGIESNINFNVLYQSMVSTELEKNRLELLHSTNGKVGSIEIKELTEILELFQLETNRYTAFVILNRFIKQPLESDQVAQLLQEFSLEKHKTGVSQQIMERR